MSKGIESLSSAIFNLGTGIDKNIVKLVSVLPRLTLYNYGSKKLDTRSAPKIIYNFDVTNETAVSDMIDYAEGVGAYGALGLICFGILLIEFCCFVAALIYSMATFCCCKFGERDQKFRLDNYSDWAKDHDKRKKIICAFRIILLIWVILNIALLVVWFVFAYQSNIEISNFLNKGINSYNEIEALVSSVLQFAKNLPTTVTQLETQYNQFKTSLLSKLPTKSKLSEWNQCVTSITQQVPSINNIELNINNINEYLNNNILNRIKPLQDSIIELKQLFITIGDNHVNNLQSNILIFQSCLINLSNSLNNFINLIDLINLNLNKITYLDFSFNTIQVLQDKINTSLTFNYFNQYEYELSHLQTSNIVQLSNMYYETIILQNNVNLFKIPINNLINNLNLMNSTLSNLPKQDEFLLKFKDLEFSLNQIKNLDLSYSSFNLFENDVNQTLPNKYKLLKDDLRSLTFAINSIPSLQFINDIYSQVLFFNSILQQTNCIDNLMKDIKYINDTFVELPNVNLFDYYDNSKNTLNNFVNGDITKYYNSINSISNINQQVISSISILFNTTLDLSLINLSNLKQVLPIQEFKQEYSLINLTSLNSTYLNYYNNINNLMNLYDTSNSFIELNTTLNDFDDIKLENFKYLLNAVYNQGKTTCYNDFTSQCQVLNTKSLEFYPKVVNFHNSIKNLTQLQYFKTQIQQYQLLISKTIIKNNQLPPLKNTNNNFNFNQGYTLLSIYGNGIKQIGLNLPLQKVSDGIKNGNTSLSCLPFNDFTKQIESCQPILQVASDMDISAIINQFDIQTFSSYLNLGSIFTNIITTLGNVKVQTYIWWKDEINYQLNNIYMIDILKWDGYRLLGVIIFISFIVLLPLIAILPTCCYRCPSFLYFEIIFLMLLGLLGCAVIFFMLPVNILLSDTCSNLENYIIGTVDSYGNQLNATLKFEASFYKYNITFNTDLHELAQTYLVDCKNDEIAELLQSIKFIVDDSPNLVASLISSLGSNVKIRPALVKSIQDTIYSLMNNLYTSLMQVASLVTCKSLSTKYSNIKNLVCQDGSYFISTFWFLFALLTFLILVNIAVYITIYVIFRYFWYDTKIIVKSNILTSADRTVVLGNEHRMHHHSHHHHAIVTGGGGGATKVRRVRQNVVFEKEMRDSTGGIILEDI